MWQLLVMFGVCTFFFVNNFCHAFWLGKFQMIQLLMLIVKTSKHAKHMLGLLYNSWLTKNNVIQNIVLIMYVGSRAGIVVSTT
jgi:hypothetical protein